MVDEKRIRIDRAKELVGQFTTSGKQKS